MLGHLLLPEIQEMVRTGDFAGLRDALADLMPPDLAELIEELPPEDEAVLFRIMPRKVAAEIFGYLSHDKQETLLRALGDEKVAELLNAMAPDDRTALLEELPSEATRQLLTLLAPEELAVAKKLLGYPEGSIGRRMTPDYVAIREDWTIEQVLEHVRRVGRDSETLNVLYVTDQPGRLLAAIRVRDILLSPPARIVRELMSGEVVALKATEDQEAAVQDFRKYDVVALPVTDSQGMLLGIVTVDDVLDVVEQEATEDIQKIGGMAALDEPYMQIGLVKMIKKRVGWLIILFLGGMFTTTAIGSFEHELDQMRLALFLVLVISAGGNSGSQASTLVIRALSLGEIRLRDWWRVLRRELVTASCLGIILGVVGFLRIATYDPVARATRGIAEVELLGQIWPKIGVVMLISVFGVVLWGSLVGSMLPFVLKRLGFDPATSSSPFVATLVDVTGILIYFNVAMLVIGGGT
ncbi:MAG: magnesium transporter [Candidatus Sumerlaeaceae bacterium]